jgi:hypothetical protein
VRETPQRGPVIRDGRLLFTAPSGAAFVSQTGPRPGGGRSPPPAAGMSAAVERVQCDGVWMQVAQALMSSVGFYGGRQTEKGVW